MPVGIMRSKKCRRKPRPQALRNHFGMADWRKEVCFYTRPHLKSSPPGEEITIG